MLLFGYNDSELYHSQLSHIGAARGMRKRRPGPSSIFAVMSDEEVISERGTAAETEFDDVSDREMDGANEIRFRTKKIDLEANQSFHH